VRSFIDPDLFDNSVPFNNTILHFIWSVSSGNWA